MEHIAQGKRSDTLGIVCWSSRALKGQKLYDMAQVLDKYTYDVPL